MSNDATQKSTQSERPEAEASAAGSSEPGVPVVAGTPEVRAEVNNLKTDGPGVPASKPEEKKADKKTDEDPVGKVYDSVLVRRLGHYLKPYWVQAVISSISVTLKSLSDVAGPYLVMLAIDRYFPRGADHDASTSVLHGFASGQWLTRHLSNDPWRGITQLVWIYVALLFSSYVFEFVQTYLMQWVGQKMMFDLRRDIFRHMQRLHVAFFDTHAVGRLVTRLTSDVDAINEMFTGGILAIVDDFFTLSFMGIMMLKINWWLALLSFSVLPVILIVTRMFRNSVRESYRRVRAAIARINSFTQEHISGMAVVQLFNREKRAFDDFEVVNKQHMIAFKDTIFAYALYYPAVDFLSVVAVALVIWLGGWSVIGHGVVTIGVLAAFNMYSQRFWRPIQDLSDKYNILQAAMAACERIFKLMDTAPEIVSPVRPQLGDGTNRIEFRHVWFTYQKLTEEQKAAVARAAGRAAEPQILRSAQDDNLILTRGDGRNGDGAHWERASAELQQLKDVEWILKDVSFTIEPGSTVAIVGHTGAGKTTLTSLMMRFYDVTAGQILLDGVDLREHDLKELRQHFAVVLQDPFLFTGTIAENIRLGHEAISDAQMAQAAEDVNVADFIEALPLKFDDAVEERGNSFSTGQKQLINFARALAYNPRILILDEATSSVDTDTELRIRGALERLVEGRTSVLIAHRLSTVQRAETILVMHKGQLREMGNHQELLAVRGLYWKLYQLQYKEQEEGVGSRE
ncbi:MAG TPA: ABC transporter ATP-binding protein [Terracidiphilus sp.]|jgi:ATP-binding cassette subfamily B protein|nr:ABC transporter ATP-binding protein [Terracidiphilus sp.]